EKLGYTMVGTFHQCGYKFHRWYDMVWMEKFIGEHRENQPDIIPFPKLKLEK
ncbi:GNAT family N-acetyltransferase, partial [Soehngenia saccharolytica]